MILLTPGLDNTRLFMSLTAGAGTRSKVFSLHYQAYRRITGHDAADARCVTGMRFQDYQRSHACRLSFASWRWNKENTTEITKRLQN